MAVANDIAEFLTTRRARVTPEQAGLPTYGNASGVSELVLEGLARALQLDDAERAHLFDLARAANPIAPKRPRPVTHRIRPVVQRILDQIDAPALVRNSHATRSQSG
jgi:hypothetical protein